MDKISLNNYLSDNQVVSEPHVCFYSYQTNNMQSYEQPMVRMEMPLPEEKQLFSELSDPIPSKVIDFITIFNRVLQNTQLQGLTLRKFTGGLDEDGGYQLEWIENYFRVYFSFEINGANTVGYIVNDIERGQFSSNLEQFSAKDYPKVATEAIAFMINHKQR